MDTLRHWLWVALEVLSVPVLGFGIAGLLLFVGVVGGAVVVGWLRDVD